MPYDVSMTQPHYGAPVPPQYPQAQTPAQYPSAPPQYPSAPPQYPSAPGYPQQAYQVPAGYSPMSAMPTPVKKSPILGIVGMAIVIVCAGLFLFSSIGLYERIFELYGSSTVISGNIPSLSDADLGVLGGWLAGLVISTLIGIVGVVLSIMATAQNKGRPLGIVGIIFGVLAPLGFFLAAAIVTSQYV